MGTKASLIRPRTQQHLFDLPARGKEAGGKPRGIISLQLKSMNVVLFDTQQKNTKRCKFHSTSKRRVDLGCLDGAI